MPGKDGREIYDGYPRERPLPEMCRDLFSRQMEGWPALRSAYEALQTVRRREIAGDGLNFSVQFNPGRIVSAEARIDAASLANRPCFLCPEHRPPEQQAIVYRRSFVILCNPFPIFRPHLTIAHLDHLPQAIGPNVAPFLELAREMSPGFSVFYNGPACGASAPDHLHFQGCPAGAIPVEGENISVKGTFIGEIGDVSVFSYCRSGRHFLYLETDHQDTLAQAIDLIMETLPRPDGGAEEPMVNITASFREGRWRVFIFPRRKHRPAAFFRSGSDRRAITPGAVEMGGLVITTNESDFTVLDKRQLIDIFTEVSAGGDTIKEVADALLAR